MLAFLSALPLSILLTLGGPGSGTDANHEALVRAMTLRLTYTSTLRSDTPTTVKHCRTAAQGCAARIGAFARFFINAGKAYDIDPWLLAAVAFRESGFNPYAVGRAGERGLLQLHPRGREALGLRWYRNEAYREGCREEPGACQQEVVDAGARILTSAIETCGNVAAGLVAYQSGKCESSSAYSTRILRTRTQLLELGCPATSPLVDDPEGLPVPAVCEDPTVVPERAPAKQPVPCFASAG